MRTHNEYVFEHNGEKIYVMLNREFSRKVAEFKISPEEAYAIAEDYRINSPDNDMIKSYGPLMAVAGDSYLFSKEEKYYCIHLTGVYVNGYDGSVEHRLSPYAIWGDKVKRTDQYLLLQEEGDAGDKEEGQILPNSTLPDAE